jgi:hypothetical protein
MPDPCMGNEVGVDKLDADSRGFRFVHLRASALGRRATASVLRAGARRAAASPYVRWFVNVPWFLGIDVVHV